MKKLFILNFTFLITFAFADAPVDAVVATQQTSNNNVNASQAQSRPVSVASYESEGSMGSSGGIEEVVVTASKKEESLQEAPIAITALTESTIEDLNITSLTDVQSMSPNVHILRAPSNNTSSTITIRGNGTMNPAITWENAVAMYVDGVYVGKTQGSLFDLVDLERVELLRGPQGTLYGRNALAGAINFISKKPSGSGGKVKATIGNYGLKSTQFSYDIGFTDKLFTKVTAMKKSRDGYTENFASPYGFAQGVAGANPVVVDELDTIDMKASRVVFSYQGDAVEVEVALDKSEQDNTPPYGHLTRLIPNWSSAFGVGEIPGVLPPGFTLWPLEKFVVNGRQANASVDAPTKEMSDIDGRSLTVTFDTPIGEVKGIVSDRELKWYDFLDLDGSPFPIFHTNRDTDYNSESYELQLVGSRGIVDYVIGYFDFRDEAYTDNPQYPFALDNPEGQQYSGDTDAEAIYAQFDIHVTDKTTITAGIRETDEKKSGFKTYSAFGVSASSNADFNNTSTTFIVNHQLTENTNVYAKLAEGFKGGGFNAEEAVNYATFQLADGFKAYAPETIESTEIGLKGVYLNNRLGVNIAYFMNEHTDMQVAYFTAAGAAASEVLNASADIDGMEIEIQAYLSDVSRLNINVGLLDIGGYTGNNLASDGFALQAFPYSPQDTIFLTYERDFADFTLRVDHEHVSEHYAFPYNSKDPRYEHSYHGGRDVTNLRIIMDPTENLDVVFWIKNLTDKAYSYTNIPFGPGFGNLNMTYFAPPRTIGLDLRYTF
ncbi:MAG: TonB-dependent receptor [Gammaproteobacteria bacterium]